jgi:hypothetical protein
MSRAVTFTKAMVDRISNVATRRMQVEMANLLIKDRELLGRLINESLGKKESSRRSLPAMGVGAGVAAGSQNQNAMAR